MHLFLSLPSGGEEKMFEAGKPQILLYYYKVLRTMVSLCQHGGSLDDMMVDLVTPLWVKQLQDASLPAHQFWDLAALQSSANGFRERYNEITHRAKN